jgi:hypothetical protein
VKIKGTCKRDGREFLAEQVIETGGECPWDGEPFQPDYAVTLVNAFRDAEEAGSALEEALTRLADIRPALTIDAGSVLGELKVQLARLEQDLVRNG